MIEKQQNMEASWSQQAENTHTDIKEKYKEIKAKNEELKNEIYSQYLKQTLGNQKRLLSSFHYANKKLLMTMLQPTIPKPTIAVDYKKVNFEVPVERIHPLDQIEFHKQSSEMLYSTMTIKAMSA